MPSWISLISTSLKLRHMVRNGLDFDVRLEDNAFVFTELETY